jgi:hypothetical protein
MRSGTRNSRGWFVRVSFERYVLRPAGAAVGWEARLVWAPVGCVEDAVAVVVWVGAAVFVLEAVHVLGVVGAEVDVVGDSVAVAVGAAR